MQVLKSKSWWFIGVFALLFFVFAYQKVLFFPPQSIHVWRQTDCLSLAEHFMDENNPFQPEMHNRLSDGGYSGKTAGEFTGLYYIVGKIWNITGRHQSIFRLINLMIMFFGCFALFRALNETWKNTFWSLFISLFLFTSPIIVYYTPNYLTDITALALSLWGWSYFIRYLNDKKQKRLYFALAFFGLAALFKITSALSILSILGVVGLEWIGVLRKNAFFTNRTKIMLLGVLSLVPVVLWYMYVHHYTDLHHGKYTFNSLWPLWELSQEHYQNAIKFFTEITFDQLFYKPVFWILTALTLFALYTSFRNNIRVFLFLVFLLIGSGLYIIFWFGALENHDYYFINLFVLPLAVLGIVIHYEARKHTGTYFIPAVLIFTLGIVYAANNLRIRYLENFAVGTFLSETFYDQKTMDYWYYVASSKQNYGLYSLKDYNRSIGIQPEDLVICYPDISFNVSLYLMDQEGWTSYNNEFHDSIPVKEQIKVGAKYLIINRVYLPETPHLQSFMKDSVGYHDDYTIYRLHREMAN